MAQSEGPQLLRQTIAWLRARSYRRTLHIGHWKLSDLEGLKRPNLLPRKWKAAHKMLGYYPSVLLLLCFLFPLHQMKMSNYRQLGYHQFQLFKRLSESCKLAIIFILSIRICSGSLNRITQRSHLLSRY